MNFIAISLIAAALVWGAALAWRGSLVAGCLVYLLLVNCFGIEFYHFDIAGITLSVDRVFLVLLGGSYLVQRRLGRTDPKPLSGLDYLLAAFIGLVSISAFWARSLGAGEPQLGRPLQAGPVLQHLTNGYLIPLLLYWIARQSRMTQRSVSFVHASLALFGLYLAATGVLEFCGQWGLVFPRYIADPEIGSHFGRARGPMVQSVSLGLYLGVCWLAAWVGRERLGRLGAPLAVLSAPLFLAALYCTQTRSVWLGVGLGGLMVLWLTLRGAWRPLVLGSIASAGLLVAVSNAEGILSMQRGDNSASETRESAGFRKTFAYVSWNMFLDRPLLGVGFGQFPEAKIAYLSDRRSGLLLEPIRDWAHHNTYLSLLTELGLGGLILFVALVAGWARLAWRQCHGTVGRVRETHQIRPNVGWSRVRETHQIHPNAGWDQVRETRLRGPDWVQRQAVVLLGALVIYGVQAMCHDLTFTPIDNGLLFFLAGLAAGAAPSPSAAAARLPPLGSAH